MRAGSSLGKGEQTHSFHKIGIIITQEGGQPLVSFVDFWWEAGSHRHTVCSITDGVLRAATRALGGRSIPQGRVRIGLTARGVEDSRPGVNRATDIGSCPGG
jgi:hypothetical protein